jgi:cytoplasmic iron level regulating protein YaaA (DUF328/UPF0246 family)
MANWILLLPPSEGKAPAPAEGKPLSELLTQKRSHSFPELTEYRLALVAALQEVLGRPGKFEELFEVKGPSLQQAIRDNRRILESPTLPARELYNGVLYEALNYPTLSKTQKAAFNANTLIFSGLYGVVRPGDRLAPYKLKAGADLGGMIGKLVHFWRPKLSTILRSECRGRVVWNFLPDPHIRMAEIPGDVVAQHHIKFVKRVVRSGVAEWKTISHHSKALKGALVRHLLATEATSPSDLRDFTHPDGYRYASHLSVENPRCSQIVFAAE